MDNYFFQRINDALQHFFKRIYDDYLRILVKTANFAGTKNIGPGGHWMQLSGSKNGAISGFCTRIFALC